MESDGKERNENAFKRKVLVITHEGAKNRFRFGIRDANHWQGSEQQITALKITRVLSKGYPPIVYQLTLM